jgi:hypothetical protein
MLSLPLLNVLKNRASAISIRFLAPSSWSDMPSPFELEGMEPASHRTYPPCNMLAAADHHRR